MVLMKSDQCPCWAGYPKGNSECISMSSVLLWMLLPVLLFTSSPNDQSWIRIWQEQQQKLFSFHHALHNSSVLRVWDSTADQLRVPSGSRWPRGIMTSPGRSSTQERDICSRRMWTFLLTSSLFTLWGFGLHLDCVVGEAPQITLKRGWSWGSTNCFLSSVTQSLTVLEESSRRVSATSAGFIICCLA